MSDDAALDLELIAELAHEINRAYCEGTGDHTQKPWDEAEDWQRASAVSGVKYTLANPDATPESQHLNWMADKVAAGWKRGDVKDAAAKTHPCIVAYDQLPEAQRVKDHLFQAAVRMGLSLLRRAV